MSRRLSTDSSPVRRTGRMGASRRVERSGVRTLHLDCFSGIAGNMFLGALLDLGLKRKELEGDLAGLDLEFSLKVRKVKRGTLAARYVDVGVPRARPKQKSAARKHSHGHPHHGRSFGAIVKILERARLDGGVRERAIAIFEALARAEARVHGKPVDEVHFHEVGAVDAIVDVTGAAIGLARLEIDRVTSSPVALGEGSVETEHGRLPLPAPATLELLRGVPTVPAHVNWETVTPTGAAILKTIVEDYGPLPALTIESIGLGAGNDRPGPMPNVLRAVLGRSVGAGSDRIVVLETNLDDLVPEHFDYLMERLFEVGALDVSVQPLQMKKNRPGHLVRVLGHPSDRISLARILFAESTAIGVRVTESDRIILKREVRRVDTTYGRVRVKRVFDLDGRVSVSPEYDDCKRLARSKQVPLRKVVQAAEEAGRGLD
ncbi:MAG: nickel pincer cofactor biosynthesis protein LarC [Deltaproteobacteria bacterium]|nr:MAG: nickel pincer cofactor biosynthesis protein LarC [Deltaproteobacteria bacterium]